RGQDDGEGRSLVGAVAFGGDFAAMHVDDTLDDREPKARRAFARGRLGGEALEAAEQAAEILGREARALVGDADERVVVVMADADGDLAADRTVLDGVGDEIVDRLA